jgi:hypothetical protein
MLKGPAQYCARHQSTGTSPAPAQPAPATVPAPALAAVPVSVSTPAPAPVTVYSIPTPIPIAHETGRTLANVFSMAPLRDVRPSQPNQVKIRDMTIKLDKADFITAYIPSLEDINQETGLENKLGGHMPFFRQGDSWPVNPAGRPLAFVMQFVDPRPNKNELVQLFFDDIHGDDVTGNTAHIRRLDLTQPLTQVHIPEPADVPKNDNPATRVGIYSQAKKIVGWLVRDEPPTEEFLELFITPICWPDGRITDSAEYDRIYDQLYREIVAEPETMPGSYRQVKIGGYGDSAQGVNYTEFIHNLYNGLYGDSGVLHVNENGIVTGDNA